MTASHPVEDTSTRKDGLAVKSTSIDDLNAEARMAADKEHNLTFVEAVKSYPTAVAWALFFSLGVIMAVRTLDAYCTTCANIFRLLTLSSLATFMRLRRSKETSVISMKANTSFLHLGKLASAWAVRWGRSLELSSHHTPWNGSAVSILSAPV